MKFDESYKKAADLDAEFPCFRSEFCIPPSQADPSKETAYLCGNSLGLMPKATREAINNELDAWATLGVEGHFRRPDGSNGWVDQDEPVIPKLAKIVGCLDSEVAFTGGLTNNLNSLLATFYKPTAQRYKIMFEARAFPSDSYSLQSQALLHGFDPKEALVLISPREGEATLRTEDILEAIAKEGESLALVMFSGVQYLTGQKFDMKTITKAAHDNGSLAGWDLAHAVGNVELEMHEWGADFAVFCTYKYLCCGAGAVAGLYIHERHHDNRARPAGWFGVSMDTRFDMEYDFKPIMGARGWVQSCLNWSGAPAMLSTLALFEKAGGVSGLQPRARSLTGFLETLIKSLPQYGSDITILTPANVDERGSQLSIKFKSEKQLLQVKESMLKAGVVGDARKPDVMRITPCALYCTHNDVVRGVEALSNAIEAC